MESENPSGEANVIFFKRNSEISDKPNVKDGRLLTLIPDTFEKGEQTYERKFLSHMISHEIGHLLGLTHVFSNESLNALASDLMSHNPNRGGASVTEVMRILSNIDYTKNFQKIKGDNSPE